MRDSCLILIFPLVLPTIVSSLTNYPIVRTSYGAIRGYEYRASNGFTGEIYKKIPFAAPPIKERRWKKPQPPQAWNYTIDGTFAGPACAQINTSKWDGYVTGFSEDCLTLNIYTSKECRESNGSCPVVVYIHGGSLVYSSAVHYPDDTLIVNYPTQGVIMVTIAYRVGVFGVMALGDENVLPANLALHDIVESLRFLRQEVHVFGGDKDQISIMGHSIGANIALFLTFSPAVNRGGEPPLFARAICISASMNLFSEDKQVTRSHSVASYLGCDGTPSQIVECLQQFITDEIIAAASSVGGPDQNAPMHLNGITMAGELYPFKDNQEFLSNQRKHMEKLAPNPPTKLMIGTIVDEFRLKILTVNESLNEAIDTLGVSNLDASYQKWRSDWRSGTFDPEYDTLSQAIIVAASLFSSTHSRAGGEAHLFELDYPKHSSHADDFYYLLGVHPFEKDTNEEWLSRVYPLYFTNFIKGLPIAPDWELLNPDLMNYYSINKSFIERIVPHMELGYHRPISDYYTNLVKFDENISIMKSKVLNATVQYKELIIIDEKPFSLREIIICSAVFGVLLFLLCLLCQCSQNGRNIGELIPLKSTV